MCCRVVSGLTGGVALSSGCVAWLSLDSLLEDGSRMLVDVFVGEGALLVNSSVEFDDKTGLVVASVSMAPSRLNTPLALVNDSMLLESADPSVLVNVSASLETVDPSVLVNVSEVFVGASILVLLVGSWVSVLVLVDVPEVFVCASVPADASVPISAPITVASEDSANVSLLLAEPSLLILEALMVSVSVPLLLGASGLVTDSVT